MAKHLIISDKSLDFLPDHLDIDVVSATDFIANRDEFDLPKNTRLKVINLCSNFEYLSTGYYCSLLAEARGMRCVPETANVVTLQRKRYYASHLSELNDILAKHYDEPAEDPFIRSYTICFGRCQEEMLEALGRRLFDLFRFPLMTVQIKLDSKGLWVINNIEPLSINDLPKQKHAFFIKALSNFTGSSWRSKGSKKEKYWMAILHDPDDPQPPSNKKALQNFIKAGKALGVFIELITKADFATVLEFDAILIRATTAINHYTYSFALKAENEGIACIDDTQSIIRCCNKVFQHEILSAKKINVPKTYVIDRKNKKQVEEMLSYPAVVKIPDGSFSRGVIKVDDVNAYREAVLELLKSSDIVLAQEFIKSNFDWRVGILDHTPLYACKYYMADDHWQIYNHKAKAHRKQEGDHETVPLKKVPPKVMETALKAAKLIGNGLYGVDLKETDEGIFVMEVNDNPNIDAGVEDQQTGDKLYKTIIQSLINRVEE